MLALVAHAQTQPDANTVALPSLEVTEKADVSGPPTLEEAKEALNKVSGATHVADSESYGKGRVGTTADILAYQPGVFAQETAGGDGIKLSIRGSAINRGAGNSYRSGIFVAFDGLPVTIPGGAPYELQEPFSFSRAEILIGANGFEYGPRNFGGAINYITPTGYDSSVFGVRAETGSFGYYKTSLSSGAVSGALDYYVNITGAKRQGFQPQSELETLRIAFNTGYKISDTIENRLYFRYGYTDHESPGSLTKAEINNNPRSANPANIATNSHRTHPGTYWIGDKLTIKPTPDSNLELGVLYHDYPIEIYGAQNSFYEYGTLTLQAKYKRHDDIAGRDSNSTLAIISSTNLYGYYNRYIVATGVRIQKNDFTGSADNVALAQNDLEFVDDLWLTTGVSVVNTRRKNVFSVSNPVNYERNDFDFVPRAGLRYDITPDVQVYTNISRSIEPRNDWAGSTGTAPNFTQIDLKNQTATTWEVGTRAKRGIFEGSLSYFNASIKNALLSVEIAPGLTAESNASPTEHQGIELGLDTLLWQEGGYNNPNPEAASRLIFRQSFTWSDYRYKNDATFGSNRLPGVPENYYQAELLFQHSSGFYVSVNAKAASSAFVDYANTAEADSWVVYGSKIGYEPTGKKWQVYLDLRNITDEHYTAAVSPSFNDAGADLRRHSPGDLFSIYAGFEYRF